MFSSKQYYTIVVLTLYSATMSCFGSYATLVASWRGKNSSLYQIILLLLSAVDLLGSFALIFHPFSLPRPTRDDGVLWASGNDATCGTAAFFFVACYPLVSFFHMYLSGYFLAKVRYNTQDTVLSKRFMWHGVAVAVFLCFALAFMVSASQSFVPRIYYNVCYFGDCPEGEADCQGLTSRILHGVQLAMLLVPSVLSLVLTLGVLGTVRAKLAHGQKIDTSGRNQRLPAYHQDKLKAIRFQALLYCIAHWSGLVFYFLYGIVGRDDSSVLLEDNSRQPLYFALALISWIFFAHHGIFNYAVYIRPRYLLFRKANKSVGNALTNAITFQPVSLTLNLAPATSTRSTKLQKSKKKNSSRSSMVWLFGGLEEEAHDPSSTVQEDMSYSHTNRTGRGSQKEIQPVAENWKDDESSDNKDVE